MPERRRHLDTLDIFHQALKRFEMVIGVRPDISTTTKSKAHKLKKKLMSTLAAQFGQHADLDEEINIIADWDIEKEKSYLASKCLGVLRLCIKNHQPSVNPKHFHRIKTLIIPMFTHLSSVSLNEYNDELFHIVQYMV